MSRLALGAVTAAALVALSVGLAHPAPDPPPLPSFAEGLPAEDSPKPTADEWRGATEVRATRMGPRAKGCHVYRVREWVRVSCPDLVTATISVLGGTATGYAFWIDPSKEGRDAKLPAGGEIQFPVRRGDRRVVQVLTFGPGYEGPFTQLPALVVQEHWLDDEAEPIMTIL